jgi:pimeloyl-ACP methyl ester carboxylesterase
MTAPPTEIAPTTATLDAPGATITYDVRASDATGHRPLMLIGSPMGAAGFGTLARHFVDRTVITYDPRGVERSTKDDPTSRSTPEQHADDLHRIIERLGLGPVDLFASSGGAVNALALVAAHPENVATLVAHEPPLASLVPDRDAALATIGAASAAYQQRGSGVGMAWFITLVSHDGPFTPEMATGPGPDPAMFGMPAEDDGTRTDPLLAQNLITCTHYQPDIERLEHASTTIVIAVGEGSGRQLARRGGEAVAAQLGLTPVLFPGDHGGFLGGEYGQTGDPDAFAVRLHEVLDAA